MKKKIILSAIFICYLLALANKTAYSQTQEIPPWNKGTIKTQFDYLIVKSTLSSDYRVVNQSWLYILKARVLDTIKIARLQLAQNLNLLEIKTKQVDSLQTVLKTVNENLTNVSKEKESMAFVGIRMGKHSYHTLVWSIIGVLLISLLLFIGLFKRSNSVTVQTKISHEELKEEFEAFRKRALLREEEMARKHLYELNKYKH